MLQITAQTARNIAELSETDNQTITVQSVTYIILVCCAVFIAAYRKDKSRTIMDVLRA